MSTPSELQNSLVPQETETSDPNSPIQCTFCDKFFTSPHGLAIHKSKMHRKDEDEFSGSESSLTETSEDSSKSDSSSSQTKKRKRSADSAQDSPPNALAPRNVRTYSETVGTVGNVKVTVRSDNLAYKIQDSLIFRSDGTPAEAFFVSPDHTQALMEALKFAHNTHVQMKRN